MHYKPNFREYEPKFWPGLDMGKRGGLGGDLSGKGEFRGGRRNSAEFGAGLGLDRGEGGQSGEL